MSTYVVPEQTVTTPVPDLYPVTLAAPEFHPAGDRDIPFIRLDEELYAHVANIDCDLSTPEGRQYAAEWAAYLAALAGRGARFGLAIRDGVPVTDEVQGECGIYLHDLGNGLSRHALLGALVARRFIAPEFFSMLEKVAYGRFLRLVQKQLGICTA